ncbi:MAG: EutN/CcmL family microcompartment protein [Promethearchaeota archaeon]
MYVGKVIGTVVCSVKDESLKGVKLLVVQPLDEHRKPIGNPVVAVDAIGTSGVGEFVYLASKKEAAFPFARHFAPVDEGIMGFIDEYYIDHSKRPPSKPVPKKERPPPTLEVKVKPVPKKEKVPPKPVPIKEKVPSEPVPEKEKPPPKPIPIKEKVPSEPVPIKEKVPSEPVPEKEKPPPKPIPKKEKKPPKPAPIKEKRPPPEKEAKIVSKIPKSIPKEEEE